jgi:hypothetical protein
LWHRLNSLIIGEGKNNDQNLMINKSIRKNADQRDLLIIENCWSNCGAWKSEFWDGSRLCSIFDMLFGWEKRMSLPLNTRGRVFAVYQNVKDKKMTNASLCFSLLLSQCLDPHTHLSTSHCLYQGNIFSPWFLSFIDLDLFGSRWIWLITMPILWKADSCLHKQKSIFLHWTHCHWNAVEELLISKNIVITA